MDMDLNLLREDDLVNNPTARVPICLCLDVSGSMCGQPIRELNEGIKLFYDTIREDETARYAAEICIVTFGDSVECVIDFSSIDVQPNAPTLDANGLTPMGEAVNLALDLLENRKSSYKNAGVDYYQPWLVLMTDGEPNGDSSELSRSINRTVALINDKKLSLFPIGIGSDVNMSVLAQYSPKRSPLRLKELKFKEFFEWLSQSVSRTSMSVPGDNVPLSDPSGWGSL